MPDIKEIRAKYPQYGDLSDQALTDALHEKFYSDIPKEDYYKQLGISVPPGPPAPGAAGDAYEPTILPLKKAAPGEGFMGFDYTPSKLTDIVGAIPGSIKSAVTAPGRAARGELTPEQMNSEAFNLAGLMAGTRVAGGAGRAVRAAATDLAPVAKDAASTIGDAALSTVADDAVKPRVPAITTPITGEVATAPADQLIHANPQAARAEELLYKNMIESGWTPERIAAKLKQLGPNATMADLEPFAGLQEAAAQTPLGAKTATRVLGGRAAGAESRMLSTVDNTLSPENYYKSLDDLKATRNAKAQPQRKLALSNPMIVKSDVIQRMMPTPEFQQGIRLGGKIANLEQARTGIEIPRSETWFHGKDFSDPNLVVNETPTLRMLDAAKQGFDQILQPFRNKYTGQLENLGPYEVEVDKARRAIVEELRTHSKDYAKYLDSWADDSQQMDALARGRKILNNDSEVTAKSLKDATPQEMEFLRIGMARALKDKLRDNPQAALRYFDKGPVQEKMRLAFESKGDWNLFRQQALREAAQNRTFNGARSGSQTMRRALGVEEMKAPQAAPASEIAGVIGDVLTVNKTGLGKRALRYGVEKLTDTTPAPVANEMTKVLHTTDPVIQSRMLNRFRQRYQGSKPMALTEDLEP